MAEYTPDSWVILKITPKDEPVIYKVLAGWYGGFANGDSWKLNSGITAFTENGDQIGFVGESGSVYTCHTSSERFTGLMHTMYRSWLNYFDTTIDAAKIEHISFDQFKQEFQNGSK